MRKAEIKMFDKTAGWLTQDENGYHFVYDKHFLQEGNALPISLTLPLQEKPFSQTVNRYDRLTSHRCHSPNVQGA
jgi:serine/threonine-protein kinase HipA